MHSTILCILALTELFPAGASNGYVDKMADQYVDRLAVCIEVANKAEILEVSPSLMVAMAYEESRFDDQAKSSAGAIGALQVIPRYTCPKSRDYKQCDLVSSGIVAIRKLVGKYKRLKTVLCHYNAGNKCNERSRIYARNILKRRHRLRAMMKNVSWDFIQDDKTKKNGPN